MALLPSAKGSIYGEHKDTSLTDFEKSYDPSVNYLPSSAKPVVAAEPTQGFTDDAIDAMQGGLWRGLGNLTTGARQSFTDDKEQWGFENTAKEMAEVNRQEIDPVRRAQMDNWGFGKEQDVSFSNTALKTAESLGTSGPYIAGALAGTFLHISAKDNSSFFFFSSED